MRPIYLEFYVLWIKQWTWTCCYFWMWWSLNYVKNVSESRLLSCNYVENVLNWIPCWLVDMSRPMNFWDSFCMRTWKFGTALWFAFDVLTHSLTDTRLSRREFAICKYVRVIISYEALQIVNNLQIASSKTVSEREWRWAATQTRSRRRKYKAWKF